MWRKENPPTLLVGMYIGQLLWRAVWRFLKKLNIELPYDPAIPLLGTYLDKTIIWKDTRTPMFIAALFTIAKTWKQHKCPLIDDCFKKMWYTHTHSGILLSHKKEWNIAKSGRERQILCKITYMWNLKNNTNEFIYKTDID